MYRLKIWLVDVSDCLYAYNASSVFEPSIVLIKRLYDSVEYHLKTSAMILWYVVMLSIAIIHK